MKLNCDLGESFGAWTMPVDDTVMEYIDQANIACGFHAGDPVVMKQAIKAAVKAGVTVGAHPSYPDLQGFGRRSMAMSPDELKACIQYQVAALSGMAGCEGAEVHYVKPHGALYNDLMQDAQIRQSVMEAVAEIGQGKLALMIQAHPSADTLRKEAAQYSLPLLFEAFADRRYTDEGYLMSRRLAGAVLSEEQAEKQVRQLIDTGTVTTESGRKLPLEVDTLCVHGDSPGAVAMVKTFRTMLNHAAV